MKVTAIIVAAGKGSRMGAKQNKVFLRIANATVLEYTISTFAAHSQIDDIIIVTRECDIDKCKKLIKYIKKPVKIVSGGETRQASVLCGLKVAQDTDIAVIHDGARAMVTETIISAAISGALQYSAAAAGVLSKDSLKRADDEGFILATIDRSSTYLIQTPQVFHCEEILRAHNMALADGFSATDDCALYEKYIGRIKITEGSYDNIKLTTPEDMVIAKNILKNSGAIGLINARRRFNNTVKLIIQKYIVRRNSKKKWKKEIK